MAFNPLAGLAAAHATKYLKDFVGQDCHSLSVIELGNQRFRLTKPVIKTISSLLKVNFSLPSSSLIFLILPQVFSVRWALRNILPLI